MELQRSLDDFEANGILPVAISYDSVAVLRAFSDKYGITYPLLSDEGSIVIKEIGLLNENVHRDQAVYGASPKDYHLGVPYPGRFALDSKGYVTEKRLFASYRERETGVGTLRQAFGVHSASHGTVYTASDEGLSVRAYLDSNEYRWYQRLWLSIELEMESGCHVYGRPIPDGSIPVSVEVEPVEGIEVGILEEPKPRPFKLDGLDEQFHVHEGKVFLSLPITMARNEGDVTLAVTFHYQVCTDTECHPPRAIRFKMPLRYVPPLPKPM